MVENLFQQLPFDSRQVPEPKSHTVPTGLRWLDSDYYPAGSEHVRALPKVSRPSRWLPFVFLHLGALAALTVTASPFTLLVAVGLYWLRMFAVTAFYHRYFSHRTFKTSRLAQFCFAYLATTSSQRGPLWWAAHHRSHHKLSDREGDLHSPAVSGLIWSHMAWITADANMPTDYAAVKDLTKYPELVFLNRFDWVPPTSLALSLLLLGYLLEKFSPGLGTSPLQLLLWGFFVSTVVLFHCTATINSLSHVFGSVRYETNDQSKNNFFLALVTMGEGWHNNHHRYPGSARQGFFWWELDCTYYILKLLSLTGVVWDLHPVPVEVYAPGINTAAERSRTEAR